MVNNSKVLTVSYGTFSCTLDGFDDSFDTMKAIAEYFRDLAADDRYFGAEPPQPDPQVLAKIAERELDRMVQGRSDGNAVVLSPAPKAEVQLDPLVVSPAVEEPAAKEDPPKAGAPAPTEEMVTPDEEPDEVPEVVDTPVEEAVAAIDEDADLGIDQDLEELRNLSAQRQALAESGNETQSDETISEKLRKIRGIVDGGSVDAAYSEDQHVDDELDTAEEDEIRAQNDTIVSEAAIEEPLPIDEPSVSMAPEPDEKAEVEPPVAENLPGSQKTTAVEKKIVPRTHVIKMKKSDLAKAMQQKTVEGTATEAPGDLDGLDEFVAQADENISLSKLEDADLLDDLAEFEVTEPTTKATPKPARRKPNLDTDEQDLNRILQQTNAQLNTAESQSKRDAFSQMKAAVAAAEADDDAGENQRKNSTEDEFREDLAQVVQPRRVRRPTSGETAKAQTTPLKLVASQRIDTPPVTDTVSTTTPPQPRSEHVSFDEYLDDVEATSLAEVLEAAAAYTAFVEGHKAFSRPQVMTKVSRAMADDYSREDCLRIFGELLRDGTLRRQSGGQFVIDENTQFHPTHREAS